MAVLTLNDIKARFSSLDKPSAKDFSDMIDSLYARVLVDAANVIIVPAAPTTNVVISITTPIAGDQDKAWIRLNADGSVARTYKYNSGNGLWLSQHPLPPGATMLWTTTLPNLTTFDGGGSPGSGAMWEIAVEYADKFPLTVGTNAINQTGGETTHTLTMLELPKFTVPIQTAQSPGDTHGISHDSSTEADIGVNRDTGANTQFGGGDPHNNMPPWRTVYLLRRTTRLNYAA